MPLHRDIHWIGRQWAVTGHGMQLIDQKLQGFFDIEVSKLWNDALIDSMYAKEWLNKADFDKGLALARTRYPLASAEAASRPAPVAAIEPAVPPTPVTKPIESKIESGIESRSEPPKLDMLKSETPASSRTVAVEPPRVTAELKAPAAAMSPPLAASSAVTAPVHQAASPPAIGPVAPRPPVVKPVETKRDALSPKPPLQTKPTITTPAPEQPPRAGENGIAATRTTVAPQPSAPAAQKPRPTIEPVAKPGEATRGTLKLGAPEPITVTLVKRRPAETPAAATPRLQVSSSPAVIAPPAPAPLPPAAVKADGPERVVFVKPGVVEPLRSVVEPTPSAVSPKAPPVEPPQSPTLFRMQGNGRARFVRPWRVVARKI